MHSCLSSVIGSAWDSGVLFSVNSVLHKDDRYANTQSLSVLQLLKNLFEHLLEDLCCDFKT